jgi:hypothetical protein
METGLVDTAYPGDHFCFLFRPFDAVSYLTQLRNLSVGNELWINPGSRRWTPLTYSILLYYTQTIQKLVLIPPIKK